MQTVGSCRLVQTAESAAVLYLASTQQHSVPMHPLTLSAASKSIYSSLRVIVNQPSRWGIRSGVLCQIFTQLRLRMELPPGRFC